MDSSPTIGKAYSYIQQVEKERQVAGTWPINLEKAAYATTSGTHIGFAHDNTTLLLEEMQVKCLALAKRKRKRSRLKDFVLTARNMVILRKMDSNFIDCLLYTSPSPRDGLLSRMPSSA